MSFAKESVLAVILSVLILTALIIAPSPALANVFETDPPIITVRRIAEPSASVPAVVHVLNEETLDAGNIASPTDISELVPGFSFNDPFGRYNPAPSIRGLIQPGLGDDPSVGFFNDGLYLSGRSSLNSLNFDLERVEVAKGPQNALYGRNSFGGAINAVSKRPEAAPGFWFDALYGTRERAQIETGFNAPITDELLTRIALYWRDWGGYFDNSVAGGPDIGREQTRAVRGSVSYTPNSSRDVIVRLTHLEDEDGQPAGFLVPANCGARTTDAQPRLFCGEIPERPEGDLAANDVGTEQPMGYNRSHSRLAFEWEERLSNNLTWTTLLGGALEDSVFIRDDDYQATNASRAGIDTDRFDLQFDTRLNAGTSASIWQGMIGASGYRFLNHVDRIDQNYVLGDTEPGGAQVTNTTDTLGLYGSLTRRWDGGFALTADARTQWEEKEMKTDTNAITTGQPIRERDDWLDVSPKLTASWTSPQTGLLAYGSVARGYKTGGFNDRANIQDSERMYDPEENITYELGLKNIRPSQNLAFDIGAFYIDWTDQQVIAYSNAAATQNFFIDNAASTEVKGIEAALRWRPMPGLGFDLAYTYADARYEDYQDEGLTNVTGFAPDGDVSGNQLPRYSPHQLSLTGQYKTPSTIKNWDFVAGGQFTSESSQFTDNSKTSKTGARTVLNLQAGIQNGNMHIGLWVDNALNEKDPAVGIPWFDSSQGFRREWLIVPQDGTTGGLRIKTHW